MKLGSHVPRRDVARHDNPSHERKDQNRATEGHIEHVEVSPDAADGIELVSHICPVDAIANALEQADDGPFKVKEVSLEEFDVLFRRHFVTVPVFVGYVHENDGEGIPELTTRALQGSRHMIIRRSSTDQSKTFKVPKMEYTKDLKARIKRTIFTTRTTRITRVNRRIRMIRTFPEVLRVSESPSPCCTMAVTMFSTEVMLMRMSK